MASEVEGQEKTEPASGKKKGDARHKGQVAKSADLNSAFMLVFGLLILYIGGSGLMTDLAVIARQVFSHAASIDLNASNVHSFTVEGLAVVGSLIAPVVVGLMFVGLGANYAQVGFLFSLEPIQPKFGKLNPLNGIKKLIISRRSLVELLKNLFKIAVIGLVAYWTISGGLSESLELMDSDAETVLGFIAKSALSVGLKVGIAYMVLAVVDYVYQRFEYEHDLRMTKQEVKEENKQQEGDPLIKSRIRTVQRQIAYKRMMQDVPGADVVVTNPTHIAVALKYDVAKMSAPKVTAKGADLIAQKIKDVAREHGVPIVEDKLLARMLFKSVEIGEEIPEKLFQAVAQVLAYIYRLRNMSSSFGQN
jgi:flagellar biosynthetic protein FlhB